MNTDSTSSTPAIPPLPREFSSNDELVAWSATPEGIAYFQQLNEALLAANIQGGMVVVSETSKGEQLSDGQRG